MIFDYEARLRAGAGLGKMGAMEKNRHVLIIWHSRTGSGRALAAAAAQGAGERGLLIRADDAGPDDLLGAEGYIFIAPENLGALSGAAKEMLDRCYYPCLGRIEGRPFASMISAGSDGTGAERQLDRIVTGWRLRRVAPSMIVNHGAQSEADILAEKQVDAARLAEAHDLGAAMAEGVRSGIF